jgi:hypothetical protein
MLRAWAVPFMALVHTVILAMSFTTPTDGAMIMISMAMIEITTSNSARVKPRFVMPGLLELVPIIPEAL